MYRSNKVSPISLICVATRKNFDPNNPIHARMMENMRVLENGKKRVKIKPAMPQHNDNTKRVNQYHYQEEEEQLVI